MQRQKDGILLIYPNENQRKHANSGYDVLRNLMLPGMSISNGSVAVMNRQVTVYIDGHPCDGNDIQMMRPKDIEKIEYHDAPAGKYQKDDIAINFVMRQYRYGGYVKAMGNQAVGFNHGYHNVAATVNSGKTTYSVFTGIMYDKTKDNENSGTEYYKLQQETIYRTYASKYVQKSNSGYAQLRVNNKGEKNYITGKLTLYRSSTPRMCAGGEVDNNGALSTSFSEISNSSISPNIDLAGELILAGNQTLNYGLHCKYSHNKYARVYTDGLFKAATSSKENTGSFQFSAIYNLFGKRGSFTGELFHYHNLWRSNYSGDCSLRQHLWKGETLAFVTYNRRFGQRLSLRSRLGADWLQYSLHNYDRYSRVTPRVNTNIQYQIHGGMILWSFNFANTTLGMNAVSNAKINVNPYMTVTGNPNLGTSSDLSTYIYLMKTAGKLNITAVSQYVCNIDNIVETYSYGTSGPQVIKSYKNDSGSHFASAIIGATYSFSNRFQLSGNVRYLHTTITSAPSWHNNDVTGGVNMMWYIKDFAISSGITLKQKSLDMSNMTLTETPISYNMVLSYSHKNLYSSIQIASPFTKRRINSVLDTPVYSSVSSLYNRSSGKYCYVTLSYTFDFGRKTEKVEEEIDKGNNSMLLQI